MLEQIISAFERKDYRAAAQLVKTLLQQSPNHPWGQFYAGRLQEVGGKWAAAETIYRKLLQETINPKLALQARQGLQRLEAAEQKRRQAAIAQATTDPHNLGPGFLILEPVAGEARVAAAQGFSRVMNLDLYTARVNLPSRGWQLYRVGPIGELQVYGQELLKSNVPAFWMAQSEIEKIQIFRVHYFQSLEPQITVICQNQDDQLGSLSFQWSEVKQRVDGQLPLFEEVIDVGAWGKLEHKEKTLDYVQMTDLHLPERNCILRLCASAYQFQSGVDFSPEENLPTTQASTRIYWNHLLELLKQYCPEATLWFQFKDFAETTLDHRIPLSRIKPYVDLFRLKETHWDPAFQLYSTLVFLKSQVNQTS